MLLFSVMFSFISFFTCYHNSLVLIDIKPLPAPRQSLTGTHKSSSIEKIAENNNNNSNNNNNNDDDDDSTTDAPKHEDKDRKSEPVRRIAGKKISAMFEV
jgi:hypothetical protein